VPRPGEHSLIPEASVSRSALRSVTVAAQCGNFAKAPHRAATVTERRASSSNLSPGRSTTAVTGRTRARRGRPFGCECYLDRNQALARARASELGIRGRWQGSEARAQARACPMMARSRPLFVHGNASHTGTSVSGHRTRILIHEPRRGESRRNFSADSSWARHFQV
jgi:hypothetical protein